MNAKKEYRRLRVQSIENRARMEKLIRVILQQHGGRINHEPEADEDGEVYIEDNISILCYGKRRNPNIGITSVYIGPKGEIKIDGIDTTSMDPERGYDVYPENYACLIDFIAVALDYSETSRFTRFIQRIIRRKL